ncbi:GAF and ANTAR domain-containing protein [Streptomyces sp. HNM0575]|uniref:GAF and ANTAR domain-containing protein n=1 Tax=Streptomyces sp. HNM0575 TaxID=2716338 RepID=UPI00145EFC69|nr:GAF and ANTAR domain-containing protein [Streptomyces sp. HNM0575]NLU75256.1 GAF and ANTAR domain-containing protein [Streptomyces sp. HNM0575]
MAEVRLTDVFVEMADTLIDEFDVLDFMHGLSARCVELLDITAAGVMLTDERDSLQLVAASSEKTRLLELFQLQTEQGPCMECFHSGQPVTVSDLSAMGPWWPHFTEAAAEVSFSSVHAVPMRLRSEIIGALNFFDTKAGAMDLEKQRIGQALADVATIGLLQQRAIRQRDNLTEQLQTALNSRIFVEQAKGVLAQRLKVSVDEAFSLLRGEARLRNRRLSDLAQAIVDGSEQLPAAPDDLTR